MSKKEEKEEIYDIDTMTDAGKKITLAGKEYEVLPIKIKDMKYILSENEDVRIFLPDPEALKKDADWMMFGLNVVGERKETFMKIINEYVFYKKHPMTEELLNKHNWSFKEIGKFLYFWTQQVSE